MKKIFLLCVAVFFLFSTPSFAQLGLTLRGTGSYGILLKPEIEEAGLPEEKLTKGGFSFSGQILYRVAGKILSLGVEGGYLRCWKDEWTDTLTGAKVKMSLSAIPILGIIQLEAPLPLVSPYLQIGPGVYPLTGKIASEGVEVEFLDETKFGVMFAAGVAFPLAPKLNLDVGGKLHLIFTEDESTITLNPGIGILLKF